MEQEVQPLHIQLQHGPTVLFLGQAYLSLESGKDPFLSEVLRKFGGTEGGQGYSRILTRGTPRPAESIDSALAWMRQRCAQLSPPEWMRVVSGFAWNSIFTSSIDAIWSRYFRSEWRELQPLYEEKYRPLGIRNQFKLHCTYLFGSVEGYDEASRPPLTRQELSRRRLVALNLARRIPEVVTPFGVLLIEGYDINSDWLHIDELLSILHELGSGQVHIFSTTSDLSSNPDVREQVESCKIILHDESLASYLLRAKNEEWLQLGSPPDSRQHNRRITVGSRVLYVPSDLWNDTITFATVLDDSVVAPPPHISSDNDRYREFRNFLSSSNSSGQWSGFGRGFAFSRDYERELYKRVIDKLHINKLQTKPVILHGQTGTGKTVALKALAYRIRREGQHPVLFIGHGLYKPNGAKLDGFCEWIESNGSGPTLIIWDGMVDVDQYYKLLQFLASKGRKAVLVGSSYYLGEKSLKKTDLVAALALLSPEEAGRFRKFLKSIDPEITRTFEKFFSTLTSYFLVALYRLLPDTREELGKGVDREVGKTEEEMLTLLRHSSTRETLITALGVALLNAGVLSEEKAATFDDVIEIGGEEITQLQALIGLIMVPGRFNLNVPLDLLLRAISQSEIVDFVDILKKFDIFRWEYDATGNITISPRNSTEAKLLVQARLGKASTEVDYAGRLLGAVKSGADAPENTELQFAVDLARSMGPNGQHAEYFAEEYLNLSKALTELREGNGILNPRLMLQEATLVREHVKQNRTKKLGGNSSDLLDSAAKVIRDALDLLPLERRTRQMRGVLLVELSAVIGTKILEMVYRKESFDTILPLYQEARRKLLEARAHDPQNYYQVDVHAWIAIALLDYDKKEHKLDAETRAEIEADILHTFEMGEGEDYGPKQWEMFNSKLEILGYLLNRKDISDTAFEALKAKGSAAGFYLRAARMASARDLPRRGDVDLAQLEACQEALSYLEENLQYIRHDGRCLYLLLRLWWIVQTGTPMFSSVRQAVPFAENRWQTLLTYISMLAELGEEFVKPSIKYLRGLANFQLSNYDTAIDIFRELEREREVQSVRRLALSYVLSTPQGRPQIFSGIVSKVTQDGKKGWVHIPHIGREIPFNPREFNKPDIREREALNNFRIGFNYIGPIADPARHYTA